MTGYNIDRQGAIERLSQAIAVPTVGDPQTHTTPALTDFRELLARQFPLIHKQLKLEIIAGYSLMYLWKGKSSANPIALISHMDVVPATDEGWEYPAFSGAVADGCVWGRGTLDIKGHLMGSLEAVEYLLAEGFVPERDIYLCFGHDEELAGLTDAGAYEIVKELKNRGITLDMVLDEGGYVMQDGFADVYSPLSLIGVAEKGYCDIELTADSAGGHSSTPPKDSALSRIARAIIALQEHPFPYQLPTPARWMQQALIPLRGDVPFDLEAAETDTRLAAFLRNTMAPTMVWGSQAPNVLPTQAGAIINARLLDDFSSEEMLCYVQALVAPFDVNAKLIRSRGPGRVSPIDSPWYRLLADVFKKTFPDALPAPFMMLGGTDALHYEAICECVYRVSPIRVERADLQRIHSVNERIECDSYIKCIEFFITLIKELA